MGPDLNVVTGSSGCQKAQRMVQRLSKASAYCLRPGRLSKVANIHKTSTKSFFSLTSRWCKMNMDMKFPPRPKSETEGISQPSTMYLKLISELVHTAYFQFPDCCIGRCHRLRRAEGFVEKVRPAALWSTQGPSKAYSKRNFGQEEKRALMLLLAYQIASP